MRWMLAQTIKASIDRTSKTHISLWTEGLAHSPAESSLGNLGAYNAIWQRASRRGNQAGVALHGSALQLYEYALPH